MKGTHSKTPFLKSLRTLLNRYRGHSSQCVGKVRISFRTLENDPFYGSSCFKRYIKTSQKYRGFRYLGLKILGGHFRKVVTVFLIIPG